MGVSERLQSAIEGFPASIRRFANTFFLLLTLFMTSSAWAHTSEITLTKEERAWLAEHPLIVLGTDKSWTPYIILNDDGSVSGIEVDFIARINELTGSNIRIAAGKWQEMVTKAKNREIDGLALSAIMKSGSPISFSPIALTAVTK